MKLIVFNAVIFDADILVKSLQVTSNFVSINQNVVNGGVAGATLGCRNVEREKEDEGMGLLSKTLICPGNTACTTLMYNDIARATVFGIFRQQQANINAGQKHITKITRKKH